MILFYDELAEIIKQGLDAKVVEWITENMAGLFTEVFLGEVSEYAEAKSEILWMHLDTSGAEVVVNIHPLCVPDELGGGGDENSGGANHSLSSLDFYRGSKLHLLCPMFHLLYACEGHQNKGSLESIDALLGCGILMFDQEVGRISGRIE